MVRHGPHAPTAANFGGAEYIDLAEIFTLFWKERLLIVIITALFSCLAVAYALWLPNVYRSETLLAPATTSENGIGGLSSELGGLAGLAGVKIPEKGNSRVELGLAVLQSRVFLTSFIVEHDILPDLFAVETVDERSWDVGYDRDLYDPVKKTWLDPDQTGIPSAQEAFQAISELMNVSKDDDTGFVSLSIEHRSPVVARNWANWLIADLNEHFRQEDIGNARDAVQYLEEKAEHTSIGDLRRVFFDMVRAEQQTLLLANSRDDYLFRVIDPAVQPERKFKPKRALICIFGALSGFAISLIIAIGKNFSVSASKSQYG